MPRDCGQITFVMLNQFCLLSTHPPPIPLFLTHGCINHLNLEMEPKCLTKSDVQLNPNILRTKKMIKGCCKKHQNNEGLPVVMVYNASNRILKINWNLPLKFGYFHFSVSSSIFMTASWLLIFVSAKPSQTILLIDRSESRFESHTGGKIRQTLKNDENFDVFR